MNNITFKAGDRIAIKYHTYGIFFGTVFKVLNDVLYVVHLDEEPNNKCIEVNLLNQRIRVWHENRFENRPPTTHDFGENDRILEIERVIFNRPATVIFWNDGTKTVVKCCEDDTYDEYAGFCMAVCKKLFKGNGNIKRILKSDIVKRPNEEAIQAFSDLCQNLQDRGLIFGDNNEEVILDDKT